MILTSVIDHLYRLGHELATQPHDLPATVAEERIAAAKAIVEKISKLKYEMGREKPLLYPPLYQLFKLSGQREAKTLVFWAGLSPMMVNHQLDCSTKNWPHWKQKGRALGILLPGYTQSQRPSYAIR